jgi:heterodisulfide reductase subunit A
MVVLSLGVMPNLGVKELFTNQDLELDSYNYVSQKDFLVTPAMTSIDGVYVAGVASAPMDIPDTILSGGGASVAAANYIAKVTQKEVQV